MPMITLGLRQLFTHAIAKTMNIASSHRAGKGNSRGKGLGKSHGRSKAGLKGEAERSDHTLHFYSIDEVLSALQKAVRRGHARNAAFWAGELHVSGLTSIAITRLLIMTVEDVGISSPYAPFLAAAAKSLLLRMPDQAATSEHEATLKTSVAPPPHLVLVCGLARWIASLPKTRTSNTLACFQRAKAEETRRCPDDVGRFHPSSVDDVLSALDGLYQRCIADAGDFMANSLRSDDPTFLAMEKEVFIRAYMFQLSHKTEADALEPLFNALAHGLLAEERRLKRNVQACSNERLSTRIADLLSGFAAVRKMVMDLQQLSLGALDSAARMVLAQALLLATRGHHLVREGIIVVPSAVRKAVGHESDGPLSVLGANTMTTCADCGHLQIDGHAVARHNTFMLCQYARHQVNRSDSNLCPVALDLETFVRAEILSACPVLVPREVFECLLRPGTDPRARLLCLPPYCVDIHTRRGSGYPMYRDWDDCIVPRNPGLQEWDREEKWKTHGELDATGRRIASQFSRYGLIVSDEYFPGPAVPAFDIALRPKDWEHFQAVVLPVAPLDHGDSFIDRRHLPHGYGESCDTKPLARRWADAKSCSSQVSARFSESTALLVQKLELVDRLQFCLCDARNRYVMPAEPRDPYFSAAKTFSSWASENSFPSLDDFPGRVLPKILESTATSTIHDNPGGKKMTQAETLFELTGSGDSSVDVKRTAIDSRPSQITELHRTLMHEVSRKLQLSKVKATDTGTKRDEGSQPENAELQLAQRATRIAIAPSNEHKDESEVIAPRRSRWNRDR